jgi:hypothetical protein
MSRGTAFSCTSTRRGGTRTSLFGSIAQRFKALQSAAGSSHGIDGKIKENQPVVFEVVNAERGFGGGGVGGKKMGFAVAGKLGRSDVHKVPAGTEVKVRFEVQYYSQFTTNARNPSIDAHR